MPNEGYEPGYKGKFNPKLDYGIRENFKNRDLYPNKLKLKVSIKINSDFIFNI